MEIRWETNQLVSEEKDGLETEFAVAKVEEVFERRPQKVKDHGIVVTLCTKPSDKWDANTSC